MGIFQQFPYSNFHEMNLDQIIKIMRQMQDEWEATKTEWASYKDFIDNYFENLDVSQEVLDALRILASTGELNQIIDPTIATAVTDWLAAHITPTTPAIDSSLTVSGAAADARATGLAIGAQASNINVSSSNQDAYPDVNDFPNRSIINVSATANIANKPFNSFTVITTGFSRTTNVPYGGSKQIAIENNTGNVAIRSHNGTSWAAWMNPLEIFTQSSNIVVSSSNQDAYPNVNDFPNRTIIRVLGSAAILNKPFSSFTVITTGHSRTNTAPYGGSIQIAFNANGGAAFRFNNGVNWDDWNYSAPVITANPTNFIEVINRAKEHSNVTVLLESGNYTLFDAQHDEPYWKNARPATRYCGLNLYQGIKLIGIGEVNINAVYTGADEDIKENFSVFNIAGSCEINNINVEAENICYIVHDDSPIVGNVYNSAIIENCTFKHNGSNHTFVTGAPMCIGAGETNNTFRKYINNIFSAQYDRAVNIHTKTNGSGKYIIDGNYFINGTLGFREFGDGTGTFTALVHNNSLPAAISNLAVSAVTLYDYNNIVR